MRQVVANVGTGFDEIDGVVVVLFDTGGDGEDIRVEDDVFRREAHFVDQDVVTALADFLLARSRVGLAHFVEGHDHHGGAVAFAQAGMVLELLHAFFHGNGVDDALALDALQARLDHFPLRRVDHDRHARDVRFASDQVEEADHGGLGVEHPFVHVDVDHLGAGFDLLQGDFQGFGVVLFTDKPGELGGAGDVGTLANVHEQRLAVDGERLQARQAAGLGDFRNLAWRVFGDRFGNRLDVAWGGTAATADDVEEPAGGELLDHRGHFGRAFVVFTEGVGQAGVGVCRDMGVGLGRQFFQVRAQVLGAQGAVQAHGNRLGVAYRVPERFGGLARQGAPGGIGNGAGDHDRQFDAVFLEHLLHGEDRRLGVEGVEDGLDQDQVGAAFDQATGGLHIVDHQLVEGDVAVARVVDVR